MDIRNLPKEDQKKVHKVVDVVEQILRNNREFSKNRVEMCNKFLHVADEYRDRKEFGIRSELDTQTMNQVTTDQIKAFGYEDNPVLVKYIHWIVEDAMMDYIF